ncbi:MULTISPECIES: helix-turn-helix domain-containing protein [unclassified Devosia]|jgi:chromosomal replication initiation ATPase DnaA|uniref:helix-turn-helix domain-containing protein n=1 Tax=unclassified Devosia TaxID=196773 RepID=UPI001A4DFBC0|nr:MULTISPECIES: helix-turn-helix domain-containing protein [unclassified Devosia]MBL8596296.1 chromosomal replication initiator DnaA [Devosia sp.]
MHLGFLDWEPAGRLRFQKLRTDPEVFLLTQLVAQERRVSLTSLLRRSRGSGHAAAARQLAMYLCHVLLKRPQDVVAELFHRDRTTVAHAMQSIEDCRDDPGVEGEIARIEQRFNETRVTEVQHAA